jgi:hypothetical protein
MSLLDDDEQADVYSLVRFFARHGSSTIMPVAAAAGPGGAL